MVSIDGRSLWLRLRPTVRWACPSFSCFLWMLTCILLLQCIAYFIISGLERWEEARAGWSPHKHGPNSNTSNSNSDDTDSTIRAAVPIEVDEIIDVIFSPRWRGVAHNEEGPPRCFPQNVPLPQMVDILVDLWEAEGLDT
jgi:hypothetical protein